MLKSSYKMLFFLSMILGTMISISSSSWLSIWMGLEINLLSFIPLSMNSQNLFSCEASLKYFLTQVLASSMLLFSIIFFSFIFEFNNNSNLNYLNLIISSSLMMKTGVAPFHFWFPNVMEGLNWINNLILMTWQKIAPLMILSFCLNFYYFFFVILTSSMIGSIMGLNQTSLRKLMAFSSINHLGWMLSSILNSEFIMKIYFLFYFFLSFCIIYIFNKFKLFNLNQLFSVKMNTKMQKLIFFIPLLSLGGLPPFLGFFPKWMVLEMLIFMNFYLLTFLLVNFSLINLYFYIRISYSSLMLNHSNLNYNFFLQLMNMKKSLNLMNFFIFFSIFGLLFINFFFFF